MQEIKSLGETHIASSYVATDLKAQQWHVKHVLSLWDYLSRQQLLG